MNSTQAAARAHAACLGHFIVTGDVAMAQDEKPMNKMGNVVHNRGIVTLGQEGDSTITNQPPRPEMRTIGGLNRIQNTDGTFTTTGDFEVVAPYPPARLRLEAHAPGIESLTVRPMRAGTHQFQFGHTGKSEGFAFTAIEHPSGQYRMVITTKEPVQIEIAHHFD